MKLRITVDRDVLRKSAHCECGTVGTSCAIAVAVHDVFPNVFVSSHRVGFFKTADTMWSNAFAHTDLPQEASDFIYAFDRSTPEKRLVMPELSFEIDVPDVVVDQVDIEDFKALVAQAEFIEFA